ncbi:MAG: phosphatase PAP2 family protein, partial [Candidatus Diapherotrites archaeon]|nr:phosphatase PAP2 family protein [Candidatus Diapherotrites archaeon]
AYVLFPFAGLVAISRVELGLHTATDVITGALLGIAFALAFSKLRMRDVHINEIGRQAVHFLGILAVPLAAIIPQKSVAFLCFLTAMIALFISLSKWKIKAITDLLSREKENRYENAVVFYLVLAACLFILPWTLAAIAIVALTVGDAFTTFYGTHFGATPLPHNKKKTVEGAVAGFVATFLALFFIVGRELALILALVTVLAESLPANDNVTIPITTVIAATLLGVAA